MSLKVPKRKRPHKYEPDRYNNPYYDVKLEAEKLLQNYVIIIEKASASGADASDCLYAAEIEGNKKGERPKWQCKCDYNAKHPVPDLKVKGKTVDEAYERLHYSILTEAHPHSKWHARKTGHWKDKLELKRIEDLLDEKRERYPTSAVENLKSWIRQSTKMVKRSRPGSSRVGAKSTQDEAPGLTSSRDEIDRTHDERKLNIPTIVVHDAHPRVSHTSEESNP